MRIGIIPIYISYDMYLEFITTNFIDLQLSNDALFIGFLITQVLFFILIFMIFSIVKFALISIKNAFC